MQNVDGALLNDYIVECERILHILFLFFYL